MIAVAFIISTIINSIIEKDYSINIIFFTVGVHFPYLIILIGSFLYYLLKDREIFVFSDYRIIYLMALFEFILIYGKSN